MAADRWPEGAEERHMGNSSRPWLCPGNRPSNSNGTDRFAKDPAAHVQTHATYSPVTVLNQDSVPDWLKQAASHKCFFSLVSSTHSLRRPCPASSSHLWHDSPASSNTRSTLRCSSLKPMLEDEMWQLWIDRKLNCYCAYCVYPRTRAVAIMKCCPDNWLSRNVNLQFNCFWSLYFKKTKSHLLVVIAHCISCFWTLGVLSVMSCIFELQHISVVAE